MSGFVKAVRGLVLLALYGMRVSGHCWPAASAS